MSKFLIPKREKPPDTVTGGRVYEANDPGREVPESGKAGAKAGSRAGAVEAPFSVFDVSAGGGVPPDFFLLPLL
jgi:hypothetical protein